jgi:serine/threonine protein kinase
VPGHELGELLGRGAFGTVWAAPRVADGHPVAVKVVPVGRVDEAHALAREVAVLGRVEVEGLVGFHEAVGLATEPPAVAVVLDQVRGGSLERAVRARGHLSVGESVTVLTPVARALAGLHALGVTHGDVTPANVLLELSGRPLLADLGVARLAGEVPGCGAEGAWGTEGFVAPEVVDGGVLTSAADVYAVGALAWWCVTGAVPEHGALRRPLAEVVPGLPPAWCEATTQALLGDPVLRPSAAELALAYFDSAPCEPLRMVVGGDETTLLTQRLRRPTATPTEQVPTGRRRVAGFLLGRPAGLRGRRPLLRGRAGALATVAGLLVALGFGALVAAGAIGAPGWLRPAGPERAAPNTPVGTTSAPTAPVGPARVGSVRDVRGPARSDPAVGQPVGTDPAVDPAAPARDPLALMVALSGLRAEAMNRRSPDLVTRLDAPGSEALAQDTALLADLSRSGTAWEGVSFDVAEVHPVAHGTTTATVEAVVGTAAYRVVSDGHAQTRAAVRGQPMRFALVWSGGRWRVAGVSGGAG